MATGNRYLSREQEELYLSRRCPGVYQNGAPNPYGGQPCDCAGCNAEDDGTMPCSDFDSCMQGVCDGPATGCSDYCDAVARGDFE